MRFHPVLRVAWQRLALRTARQWWDIREFVVFFVLPMASVGAGIGWLVGAVLGQGTDGSYVSRGTQVGGVAGIGLFIATVAEGFRLQRRIARMTDSATDAPG